MVDSELTKKNGRSWSIIELLLGVTNISDIRKHFKRGKKHKFLKDLSCLLQGLFKIKSLEPYMKLTTLVNDII